MGFTVVELHFEPNLQETSLQWYIILNLAKICVSERLKLTDCLQTIITNEKIFKKYFLDILRNENYYDETPRNLNNFFGKKSL